MIAGQFYRAGAYVGDFNLEAGVASRRDFAEYNAAVAFAGGEPLLGRTEEGAERHVRAPWGILVNFHCDRITAGEQAASRKRNGREERGALNFALSEGVMVYHATRHVLAVNFGSIQIDDRSVIEQQL